MRLLSARALEWFRQHVTDLPEDLAPGHPDLPALAAAARIAPVLSGLRGHMSPLEDIVRRRLTPAMVLAASARLLDGKADRPTVALVLAGPASGSEGSGLWQLAMSALSEAHGAAAADGPAGAGASGAGAGWAALADRIAAAGRADAAMLALAEAAIVAPIPEETITEARIDGFARLIMQLYGFGASRPQFSHARLYGDVFTRFLRFADWSHRKGAVTAMAQSAFCLRLIDPDHDIAALISEIISNQRPDGSFPLRASHSTRDQGLSEGAWPTLMALAALNMATWRRWRAARPRIDHDRPFTACRDQFASAFAPLAEEWGGRSSAATRLVLASAMSRATGENWFLRLGLQRVAPGRSQLRGLARQLYGDPYAARHARLTLDLQRHWPHDLEQGDEARALRWLRGAAVTLPAAAGLPGCMSGEDDGFFDLAGLNMTGQIITDRCLPGELSPDHRAPAPALRDAARRHASRALLALERVERPLTLTEAVSHLDRLCRSVHLFEGEPRLVAAA